MARARVVPKFSRAYAARRGVLVLAWPTRSRQRCLRLVELARQRLVSLRVALPYHHGFSFNALKESSEGDFSYQVRDGGHPPSRQLATDRLIAIAATGPTIARSALGCFWAGVRLKRSPARCLQVDVIRLRWTWWDKVLRSTSGQTTTRDACQPSHCNTNRSRLGVLNVFVPVRIRRAPAIEMRVVAQRCRGRYPWI